MKRLGCVLLFVVLFAGCKSPDAITLLRAAGWGLADVCQPDQETLPADVCTFGAQAIDGAIAAVQHDRIHGVVVAKQSIMTASMRFPQLRPYFDFLLAIGQ